MSTDPIAGWEPRRAVSAGEKDELLATLARIREKAQRRFPSEPTFRCRYCRDTGFIEQQCECGNPRCMSGRPCDRCARPTARQQQQVREEGGKFS